MFCSLRIEFANDGDAVHFEIGNPVVHRDHLDFLHSANTVVIITKRSREIPVLPAIFGVAFSKIDPVHCEVISERLFIGGNHLSVDVQIFDKCLIRHGGLSTRFTVIAPAGAVTNSLAVAPDQPAATTTLAFFHTQSECRRGTVLRIRRECVWRC